MSYFSNIIIGDSPELSMYNFTVSVLISFILKFPNESNFGSITISLSASSLLYPAGAVSSVTISLTIFAFSEYV